ncbi:hypothetical protein E4K65_45965 [Bradyrhizobium niftali]|jgi:hypothetical protein|uniref:Transposase n=1 Tax=Bradyrhizobium niftali TaxID=2560055 RepID=A0A4Y9L2Q1_9BRAD|nr:hypothetical protein E4K65_45965 [Bradyrhizobium niftali]
MMVRLPMVAVIAPDGHRSYWVAAVEPENATEAVARVVGDGQNIRLLQHRLRMKSDALRPGEVRRLGL